MEQIPFPLILHNRMMRSPSHYRSKNNPLIDERAIRIIAYGIAQAVSITGRVRKVIASIVLMYPTCLEETTHIVTGRQRFTILAQYNHLPRHFGKLQHIFTQFHHTRRKRRFIISWEDGTLQCLVVAVALQLATPQSAEIHIIIAISIIKHSRVDAIATLDRCRLRNKRSLGAIAHCYSYTKNIIPILQRKIHVILSVLFHHIAIPQLSTCPRNILHFKHYTMVFYFPLHHVSSRKHMIILHIEMVTVIILNNPTFPIMRRINIKPIIKDMHSRICHIIVRYQISHRLSYTLFRDTLSGVLLLLRAATAN